MSKETKKGEEKNDELNTENLNEVSGGTGAGSNSGRRFKRPDSNHHSE